LVSLGRYVCKSLFWNKKKEKKEKAPNDFENFIFSILDFSFQTLHLCFVFGSIIVNTFLWVMFTTQNTIHPISLVREKASTQTTLVTKKNTCTKLLCD
jgi:hypothetical protein